MIDRREFNRFCAATTLAAPTAAATKMIANVTALAASADAASEILARTVRFANGTIVPALGQGSWHLGQGRHPQASEEEAMRTKPLLREVL
jgi:hypothetical protein